MEPSSSNDQLVQTALRLRQKALERKPILGAIVEKLGKKSLLDYVRGYLSVDMHPLMVSRKAEFVETYSKEVREMFPEEVAIKAIRQLQRSFLVSTNDHHGPLNAFDMFNAHVILALAIMQDPSPDRAEAILLLSCANISLNNASYPRGILFSVSGNQAIESRKLSLLASKHQMSALYGLHAYKQPEISRLMNSIQELGKTGVVSKSVQEKLEHIVSNILSDPAILGRKTYSAQASMINRKLWDLVLQGQQHAPALISISIERLVAQLLRDHHLGKDTLMSRYLFHPDYEKQILKKFDGIYGAFCAAEQSGTYLFWGLNKNFRRLQMKRVGDQLVSFDGTLSIHWDASSVAQALQSRQIIPSMLLAYCTLAFYYGVKCLGGYSQVNYLTFMKQAFMEMMRELGDAEAADSCLPVSTKHWSGFTFAYVSDDNKRMAPAQFLDLHLHADEDMWSRLKSFSEECTLGQALEPIFPEMYRYCYSLEEREASLLAMTPSDLMHIAKLKACINIK